MLGLALARVGAPARQKLQGAAVEHVPFAERGSMGNGMNSIRQATRVVHALLERCEATRHARARTGSIGASMLDCASTRRISNRARKMK
jgi:hypothetical protein